MKTYWMALLCLASAIRALAAEGTTRTATEAMAADNARDYDLAVTRFSDVLRLNPIDSGAYCGRGLAYVGKREFDQAIADLSRALNLDPLNEVVRQKPELPDAYFQRGRAYTAKGDLDKASADFTTVTRLAPDFADAHY